MEKLNFTRAGIMQNEKYIWDITPPAVPGIYAMMIGDKPFNIGMSKNIRRRLISYQKWLGATFNLDTERGRCETARRDLWRKMVDGKDFEIFVRPAPTMVVFGQTVTIEEVEEKAIHKLLVPAWNDRNQKKRK